MVLLMAVHVCDDRGANAGLTREGANVLDDLVAVARLAKVANEKAVTAPLRRETPKKATMAMARKCLRIRLKQGEIW